MKFPVIASEDDFLPSIDFFSEHIQIFPSHTTPISQWLSTVFEQENKTFQQVNYIFCNDDYLLEINKEYLNHKTLTDIITFPYHEENDPIEGDIFISLERVLENASKFKVPVGHELLRVIVHGALHLIGYLDKTKEAKAQMTEKENYYLLQWQGELPELK